MKKKGINRRVLGIVCCSVLILSGCMPATRTKQSIPDSKYTKAGYAVIGDVRDDGTVVLTYGLVGMKEDKITYLSLDQIEQNPKEDRHLFTNKELDSAYGLSYESDDGEWCDQVNNLANYISGNKLSLDQVNEIPVEKKGEDVFIPMDGTDLAAGCKMNIAPFLEVINQACEDAEETKLEYLALGEDVRINQKDGIVDVTFAFVGTDYRFKIAYSHLASYSVQAEDGAKAVSSRREQSLEPYASGESAFENYIKGLNMKEACGVETYDPGDGYQLALPKKGTDLADVCNIDLSKYILVLKEAAAKL